MVDLVARVRRFGCNAAWVTRGFLGVFAATVITISGCSSPASEAVPTVVPAQILNLTDWKITLPIADGDQNRPVEIFQPELASYQSQYFRVGDDNASVVFNALVGGVPQPGSKYARTELREMTHGGTAEAAWSSDKGSHSMTVREAITHLPSERPSIVAGQIHDNDDYIVLIRLDGNRLYAKADDQNIGDLDTNYVPGTVFTLRLVAEDGRIKVYYNDELKAEHEKACTCYFKTGAYLQTNTGSGDQSDDYGEVRIYDLTVQHTAV
jgi:hypothetical protein